MRAMPLRKCWFSMPVSTRRTMVNRPRMNKAGRTAAAKGWNVSGDRDANPKAPNELEREKAEREAGAAASLTVALAAAWSTKCSVTSADMNAVWPFLVIHRHAPPSEHRADE